MKGACDEAIDDRQSVCRKPSSSSSVPSSVRGWAIVVHTCFVPRWSLSLCAPALSRGAAGDVRRPVPRAQPEQERLGRVSLTWGAQCCRAVRSSQAGVVARAVEALGQRLRAQAAARALHPSRRPH